MYTTRKTVAITTGTRTRYVPRRTLIVLASVVIVVLVARISAPYVLREAINHRLARIPGYSGSVGDIDLQVIRGGYTLKKIVITKREGEKHEPLFSADEVDFSVAWRELVHRKLVGDIEIQNGHLNFVRTKAAVDSQLPVDRRWQDVVNDIFPINITYLQIEDGTVHYLDTTLKPEVDVAITDVKLVATGLRNRPAEEQDEFPAKIYLSGQAPGHGTLRLFVKLEPLAAQPHLGLNLELRDISLPVLNEFLRAYAKVDVSKGRFELYGQLAMADGRFEGYVKPFFDHLSFKDFPDEKKSLGKEIWEKVVAAVVDIVKNKPRNQLATRIPFSGEAKTMDVSTWRTIANALHHGFIQALHEGFEGTTHPDSSKTKVPDEPVMPKSATPDPDKT